MIENKDIVISRTAFLNPFPFFLLLILLLMSLLFSTNAHADSLFCSSDEIENFEEMGYNSARDIFYFMSDNQIYYVYLYNPNNTVYYDDVNNIFTVDSEYMTIGTVDSDGFRYVSGYEDKIDMYSYNNSCILKVNDNVKVKDKLDTYLTNDGVTLVNKYTACPRDSLLTQTLCCTLLFTTDILDYVVSNYILIIIVMVGVFFLCVGLFNRSKGGVR